MTVKRVIIGNKQDIMSQNECKALINTIADKSLEDLQNWFDQHFSQLSQDEQDGLWLLVKTVWAISKVLKKIWHVVKWIKR
jgi:hypothetical protein